MSEPIPVTLTLHGDAVLAPALLAIRQSVEVVSFFMRSLETYDLTKQPEFESSRFQMKFSAWTTTAEERKTQYTNWVLAKGFQDLARGIRGMLEEAYFYINMLNFLKANGSQKTKWGAVQGQSDELRKLAGDLKFPELMKAVNEGLTVPLHFEKEFLSLQKVRNCLEHRDGLVSERDADRNTQSLKLALPHLKMYGEKDGKEMPLDKGSFVEKGTNICFKNEVQEREFKLGERVIFRADEFHDIGFGCWMFAHDLGAKLPGVNGKSAKA